MKAKAPRIHLLDTELPLMNYVGVAVRCGMILRNAEPKWMVIAEEFGVISRAQCRKCIASEPLPADEKKYCYGLMEAQESRDAETLELGEVNE